MISRSVSYGDGLGADLAEAVAHCTSIWVSNPDGVIHALMKPVIDDLPEVSAARLRALGDIGPETRRRSLNSTTGAAEFVVGVTSMRLRHGGDWSLFRCSCGRRCRKLRLFEGRSGMRALHPRDGNALSYRDGVSFQQARRSDRAEAD